MKKITNMAKRKQGKACKHDWYDISQSKCTKCGVTRVDSVSIEASVETKPKKQVKKENNAEINLLQDVFAIHGEAYNQGKSDTIKKIEMKPII